MLHRETVYPLFTISHQVSIEAMLTMIGLLTYH